jgi:hypothetical protein
VILDKTLKRIRQITAIITEEKLERQKQDRLIISWQTRCLAMVTARASPNGDEELMKFAANLTIDKDELEEFNGEPNVTIKKSKVPVNASTQESQAKKNFDAAAERNNFETLAMFAHGVEKGKPGH